MRKKIIRKQKKEGRPKVLVILGPTSSGKTSLGVKLAAKLEGEIISADSRQVYRGLDIGTGKDLAEYGQGRKKITYHLIDVADPSGRFDLAQYQAMASQAIEEVLGRGKLPIIVGGSGLYLQAVIDNYRLSPAANDKEKREAWEKRGAAALMKILIKKKPDFAARINASDRHNARRLSRYLEIIEAGDNPFRRSSRSKYDFLVLGLDWPEKELRERIYRRLITRLEKEGMVEEAAGLRRAGLSWEKLDSFGLEYRFLARHLSGRLSYEEMVEKLNTAIYRFAKRQKTWFRRWEKQGRKIHWVKDYSEACRVIGKWL